jgi:hypothetical protein
MTSMTSQQRDSQIGAAIRRWPRAPVMVAQCPWRPRLSRGQRPRPALSVATGTRDSMFLAAFVRGGTSLAGHWGRRRRRPLLGVVSEGQAAVHLEPAALSCSPVPASTSAISGNG